MSIESYVLKLQQEKNPGIIEKLVLEFLSGLSWLYGKGVNKRRIKAQKQAVKVSVPVISVGNITAGGTGKTPCIMKLVQILKHMGKHPAILTRGYRGKLEKVGGIVSDWDKILLSAQLAGDEPYMMAMKIPHTPVLVGKHRTASAQNAINMGADDFVTKPFDNNVLLAKVQGLLRRSYEFGTDQSLLEYHGVILNLKSMDMMYDGEVITLTKNEFQILRVLFEHSGSIVARDDLMKELWNSDFFIDDNTLSVNVARLRKKLEEAGLKNFIETKKGIGYGLTNELSE